MRGVEKRRGMIPGGMNGLGNEGNEERRGVSVNIITLKKIGPCIATYKHIQHEQFGLVSAISLDNNYHT